MRPVAPRVGLPEVTVAENQLEYRPIAAAPIECQDGSKAVLTRWTFTAEERKAIARGEDLYLAILTFGHPLQPLDPSVGPHAWLPQESDR